jgi:hemoglobin/transferrin/lactoferrin receptor protein
MYTNMYGGDRTPNKSYIIQDTAFTSAKNTRKGVSLSNKIHFMDNLKLTLGADLTKEKLTTEDDFINDRSTSGVSFRMLPRAGRRSENQYYFNFDWQPTSWLSLTAGAKSVSYWSFDDFLNKNINNTTIDGLTSYDKEVARKLSYRTEVDNYTQEMFDDEVAKGNFEYCSSCQNDAQKAIGKAYIYKHTEYWYPDSDGKYSASKNPFLNGTVDVPYDQVIIGTDGGTSIFNEAVNVLVQNKKMEKKKDHKNWAPSISAAVQLNKNNKIYVNYNEAYRLPSLFETTLGFSASESGYDLKPEHAKNWEIAYVYNIADLLNINDGFADIKIAYFNNKTDDVIERNNRLRFTNVDQQKISGWELASRYDNGKIFGDLSLVWNKTNKVCDETASLLINPETSIGYTKASDCVDYGYQAGYLVNMALPEYQANLTLGTRLFDQKLELGTRVAYFEGFNNPYLKTADIAWFNQPLQWRDTWTIDAYAHYQHNEKLGFDLIGTNLTNEYYLDPISRTAMPAPGRTIKMGVNYKF